MKASETSLRNLLEGAKQFQIPLFQRPYSWKKGNWETLWEDLMSLYTAEGKDFYFLGPIVTQSIPGTAEGISPFIVIDGQQRLTTLTLLLAVLRHYLKKDDPEKAEEIYELYLINKFKKNDDIYKVLPTQDDRDSYKSIIQSKSAKDKNLKKDGQIYEAYKFFEKKLKTPIPNEDISLNYNKIKTILLERLLFVNITSEERDNAYLIFESLNNKGEELTQADLVRNYIFMKLPSENREEVYQKKWLPLQESFKSNLGKKDYVDELTNAFWFYLRKDGNTINEKEVYQGIKRLFDNSQNGVKAELNELIKFAGYYQRINFYDKEPEQKLQRWFRRLDRLDFTTCHIFLLNIYRDYEDQRLSLEEFEKIIQYLESYFVRRLFAGISTRGLGIVFNNLYQEVQKANPEDLVAGLRTVLLSYEKSKIWPNDEDFRQGIINKSVYSNTSRDRVKLILESLEEYLTKERVDPGNITIEHIMPQKLTKNWQDMLGSKYKSVHKKWLHTLGNLTLSGYNSELSNKPFKDKLHYLRSSNFTLNKYFQNVNVWNEEAIKSRADYLATIAIKIWPQEETT